MSAEACTARGVARPLQSLPTKSALLFVLASAIAFQLAWAVPALSGLILVYAVSLARLSEARTPRLAFRFGFLAALLVFAPNLAWFWNLFGWAAPCLWAVLAFFTGAFALLLSWWRAIFGQKFFWLAAAVAWTGLEYFRSELYFLKFSWLSAGYVFSGHAGVIPLGLLGLYGAGFAIFLIAGAIAGLAEGKQRAACLAAALAISALANAPAPVRTGPAGAKVLVAGMQLEFPPELEVPKYLDRVICAHSGAQIVMLSEYTFESGVPKPVREWCRKNQRYLIAGGKDDSPGTNFFNTAFVVGPCGEVVFRQVKSAPIQFFKDGLPAQTQNLWESPWGRIAIPVCYDLSYRRVMDRFVAQGAQAILAPFMDVAEWGAQQHELHARVAPLRAREYGIPIFRLGSSGVSQNVDAGGQVRGSLPFPGQERILAGEVVLESAGRIPADRWIAPVCSWLAGGFAVVAWLLRARRDVAVEVK